MSSVVSISSGRRPQKGSSGEYLLVELALPGEPVRSIGVLLRDTATGQVYPKIREHWDEIEEPEEAELLEALNEDFERKIHEMGGDKFLGWLEDSLSNTLRSTWKRRRCKPSSHICRFTRSKPQPPGSEKIARWKPRVG